MFYEDGDQEDVDLAAEVWRLASERNAEAASPETVLVDALEESGVLVSRFTDRKGRARARMYLDTNVASPETATLNFETTVDTALLRVEPHEAGEAVVTFCVTLPVRVFTQDAPAPLYVGDDTLVECEMDPTGRVRATFFIVDEPQAPSRRK